MAMAERIITVITEDGKKTHVEPTDAEGYLNKLKLTPTKFVQEVDRKRKLNIKKE